MKDWTAVPFDEARSILRKWREEHVRQSDETVEMWEYVVSRHPRSLGDELWLVYEQVCIAALDCARGDVFIECSRALEEKFPRSNRVLKLQAMRLESLHRYDTANHLYDQLIENDPTNMSYRKRKIAILKAQGSRSEAIRELIEYLKTFINDSETWLELSNLYLQDGDYPRAAHCLEELILSSPHNSLYLRRIAEIRYTQGGQENVELARAYFEHAVRTNPACVRSLFGIVSCAITLSQKASGQRKKELLSSGQSAIDKLLQLYDCTSSGGDGGGRAADSSSSSNAAVAVMMIQTIGGLKAQLHS